MERTARVAAEARAAALEQQLAAAQRYEAQLTALVQHLPLGLLLADPEGRIQLLNAHFRELFRLPPGLPDDVPETVPIEGAFQDPAAFAARTWALHAAGQTAVNEAFVLADGRVVELDYLVLAGGRAGRLVCYRDVTARHRAAQQLREQELFYETVLTQVPVAVAVVDPAFRYVFVNPAVHPDPTVRAHMLGRTDAETGPDRHFPPAVIAQRRRAFDKLVRTRRAVSWEQTVTGGPHPGTTRYHLRPILGPDGQLQRVVGSGFDLTAHYRAEARVREQQAFLQVLVDALPSAVYVRGAAGRVTFRNAAFAALAARVPHLGAEKSPPAEAQLQQLRAWHRQVVATGQPVTAELALAMTTGEPAHLQVHKRPLRRADGRRDVLTVLTDVTALKHAQQRAEENARAKEDFLARMSHELRTPLNGVLGLAALLEKTPLAPLQRNYLRTMQQAGQHLLALVNDVLDLAALGAQPLRLARNPFSVNGALDAAAQAVGALAVQKGLSLVVEAAAPDPPQVLGDAYRLHQVLLNLLGNALKFTARGRVALGAAVVGESPAALTVRYWVQDTGVGIAPKQQEGIFAAFAQAGAGEAGAPPGGTGLGLAISEQLVHRMGGTLRISSAPGAGATFAFTLALPRAEAAAPPVPAPVAAADYAGLRGLRVLVAEDNPVNQWIVVTVLTQRGVAVEAVANGDEALALLETQAFDAALLDIRMPGLSGVEVARALRRHPDPQRARLPLVALTANAFTADRAAYLAAGMDACVPKPFTEADLCQQLLRLTRPRTGPE
ncbi:PAS domain-containing protein [Hymenobacter coccineus]|uniref:histidine kinase n=1 Tax=Hymenobacter coccineus TaxID=1908235 RepID=A0A1G1TJF5_9BACT|nr:PAS domain-containing protein [Hymenobacter coccineus]OGX90996.1 hypothetical protein BEN49_05820 [Hymenobacter coccineus]